MKQNTGYNIDALNYETAGSTDSNVQSSSCSIEVSGDAIHF
jgi:hypothetical protein